MEQSFDLDKRFIFDILEMIKLLTLLEDYIFCMTYLLGSWEKMRIGVQSSCFDLRGPKPSNIDIPLQRKYESPNCQHFFLIL